MGSALAAERAAPRPGPPSSAYLLHITRFGITLERECFSEVAIMPLSGTIDQEWRATATLARTTNDSNRPRLCKNALAGPAAQYRRKFSICVNVIRRQPLRIYLNGSRGARIKRFVEGQCRTQGTLLPEQLDDFINDTNPVRVVDVFVDKLDLGKLGFEGITPALTGRPAYHPAVLLKLTSTATLTGFNRVGA